MKNSKKVLIISTGRIGLGLIMPIFKRATA